MECHLLRWRFRPLPFTSFDTMLRTVLREGGKQRQRALACYVTNATFLSYATFHSLRTYSALRRTQSVGSARRSAGPIRRPTTTSLTAAARTKQEDHFESSENNALVPDEAVTAVANAPEHVGGVLKNRHGAARVLERGAVAVTRQIEIMNVVLGFEQANKYTIADVNGNALGFITEEDTGFSSAIMRQIFRNHRPFKATVLNAQGDVILKVERPFAFINSQAKVMHPDGRVIGEVHQRWHLLRRKYDLVASSDGGQMKQFSIVDAPFLSWEFKMEDERGGLLGTVDRNFSGFARELFTDTGHYVLRMDSTEGGSSRALTLDERAVTLGAAISIDIDYFSRSRGGLPIPFFGGGVGGGSGAIIPSAAGGLGGGIVESAGGAAVGMAAGTAASEIGAAGMRGAFGGEDSLASQPAPSSSYPSGGGGDSYESPLRENQWGDLITEDDSFDQDEWSGTNDNDDDSGGFGFSSFFADE